MGLGGRGGLPIGLGGSHGLPGVGGPGGPGGPGDPDNPGDPDGPGGPDGPGDPCGGEPEDIPAGLAPWGLAMINAVSAPGE